MKKIAQLSDLPEGKSRIVYLSTGEEIALFNIKGEILALANACPHMGGPLGEGDLSIEDSKPCVTCPWHGWTFALNSGECLNIPEERAKCYPITVKDGAIYLEENEIS